MVAIGNSLPVPPLQALMSGSMWHNSEALHALREDLAEQVANEQRDEPDTPVVVLQTGDVEALGSAAPPEKFGYDAFPSFAFLHNELRDSIANGGVSWLDIFGNHDTWPGAYPPMRVRHRAINRERIATVPGLEGPWPGPVEGFQGPTGVPVVIARINTVSRSLLGETTASGAVSDHPPHGATAHDVLEDLTDQFAPWLDQRAVRIVVLHHPPHPFDATFRTQLTTGWLEDRDDLAQRLCDLHVQLVIAGHRHKLNPALGVEWIALPWQQPPLLAPTVQLVAESPTQDTVAPTDDETEYRGMEPLSFCRYRLWTGGTSLAVERTVFRYLDGRGGFSPKISGTLFDGIPLV
jgi:hypothetical protein